MSRTSILDEMIREATKRFWASTSDETLDDILAAMWGDYVQKEPDLFALLAEAGSKSINPGTQADGHRSWWEILTTPLRMGIVEFMCNSSSNLRKVNERRVERS